MQQRKREYLLNYVASVVAKRRVLISTAIHFSSETVWFAVGVPHFLKIFCPQCEKPIIVESEDGGRCERL